MSEEEQEFAKYESLAMDLKSAEKEKWTDSFNEALSIIGKEGLKPYQESLVESVLEKISQGPADGEGIDYKFVSKLLDLYGYRNREVLTNTLHRILLMSQANLQAKAKVIEFLLDNNGNRLTTDTLKILDVYLQPHASIDQRLTAKAMECAFNLVILLGRRKGEETKDAFFELAISKMVAGNFPEGLAIRMTKVLATDPANNFSFLRQIRDSEFLSNDVKQIAKKGLIG